MALARYHHGDLARALAGTATALVAERGLEACTLREVARRAGVSPAAAYHHYRDRADLLVAVASVAFTRLTESVRDAVARAGADPVDGLVAMARGYLRFALAEPELFRAALGRGSPLDRGVDDAGLYDLLQRQIGLLVTAGALPPEARAGADLAVWTTVHGLAQLILDGAVDLGPGADPADTCDRLVRGVLRGLGVDTGSAQR
jgi:AcrR family transcriptional regulator